MMLFLEDCDGLSDEQFFDSRRRRRERSMSSSDAFLLLLFGCRLLSQAKPGTSFQVSAEIRSMRTKLLLRRSYGTSPYHTAQTPRHKEPAGPQPAPVCHTGLRRLCGRQSRLRRRVSSQRAIRTVFESAYAQFVEAGYVVQPPR